jgi:hypothetical protein
VGGTRSRASPRPLTAPPASASASAFTPSPERSINGTVAAGSASINTSAAHPAA